MKLNEQQLNLIRSVPIHKLLGVVNTGRRIQIRCPIKSERTPSFTLYPTNDYHCFSCGANGRGAIDFCVALGMSFQESIDELIKYL